MSRDLLDLLCKATNEMRDFLRREQEFVEHPGSIEAAVVKSLTARLREVGEATRAGRPEEVSRRALRPCTASTGIFWPRCSAS